MLLDSATVSRQYLRPEEVLTAVIGSETYIAGCPDCGRDAKWRDVLHSVSSGPSTPGRTIIQNELQCDHCGINDFS
jgi:hypothetical protein